MKCGQHCEILFVLVCFSLFWLVLVNIVKFCQFCETWPKLPNLLEIVIFFRFGMVRYGLNSSESTTINVGRGYVINVGRGYIITGVADMIFITSITSSACVKLSPLG